MERTMISSLNQYINQEVTIKGRVFNSRALGNVSFLLVQDYSGQVQTVWDTTTAAGNGDVVEVAGTVVREERAAGGFELRGKELSVVSHNIEPYPFDLSKKELHLNFENLFDLRTLSLRHPRVQAIFKVYDLLLQAYETAMRAEGFTEVKTPKLLGAASEGGANFFKIQYFDKTAYLAQSPQFYKQIMVGVFERVFEIGSTFRAEPHFTSRHVNEYISLDAEMGFINDFYDVTATLSRVIRKMVEHIAEHGAAYLKMYDAALPRIPEKIPHMKLAEMKKILVEKYSHVIPDDTDIDPEGERLAGQYASEEFDSDFIFLTHYPWKYRPFYTMPDKENPEETCGYDLIFKGLELVTGSQRIHDYQMLSENMAKKGVKPDGMEFYLDIFKYAMPPHGGWGMGSERFVQQLLGLPSIKEAILFPRDMKRLAP